MDWRETNLGIDDLSHYVKLYKKAKKRNAMNPDETFRATVGRFVSSGESKAVDQLLSEVRKAGA